jgi:disulfide bond formation protein DsbB
MLRLFSSRQIFWFVVIISLAAIGFALFTQYALGMRPCPWCSLQRLICVAIVIAAAPGAISVQRWSQVISSLLVGILALAGMAAALWQHFVAEHTASCELTLADQIISGLGVAAAFPKVFAIYASCSDASITLLGIPYALCTFVLFLLLGALAIFVLYRQLTAKIPT